MKKYTSTKIACYVGYVVQAIINNFLPVLFVTLQNEYHLRYEEIGRLVFINFCTQICADISATFVVKKCGYRGASLLSEGLAAGGLAALAFLPQVFSDAYAGVLTAVIIYAFGSGLIEVIVSPMIELLPSENKGASMAFLHSFYCWGQMFTVAVTTGLLAWFGAAHWRWIPLLWAIVPFCNCLAFLRVPIVEPAAAAPQKTVTAMLHSRPFICFVVFMVSAGAGEICMAEWASLFVQNGLGVSKALGDLLGPCAFALCMGLGRCIYGAFSGRYSVRRALAWNNLLCVLCYITAGLTKNPIPALAACALCGFSVSLSWPGTYSLAAARFPQGGTLMFSLFALSGDIGCAFGPWLFGVIADAWGLSAGMLTAAFWPLLMIVTAAFILKEKDCKPD